MTADAIFILIGIAAVLVGVYLIWHKYKKSSRDNKRPPTSGGGTSGGAGDGRTRSGRGRTPRTK